MEVSIKSDVLLENYLGLLNSLSRESKIKLVESLNIEIEKNKSPKIEWIDRLYGSFVSDISAEMMVSNIRKARQFNREVAGF